VKRWKKRWQERWKALKAAEPGTRFEAAYERQHQKDKERSKLVRWLRPFFAVISFAIGVVLAFIPGPAVVFFALSAALIATQSRPVARFLDRAELWSRHHWTKLRARWRRFRSERPRKTRRATTAHAAAAKRPNGK
jgi:hypothetical protein